MRLKKNKVKSWGGEGGLVRKREDHIGDPNFRLSPLFN